MDFQTKPDFEQRRLDLLQEESDQNPLLDEDRVLIKKAEVYINEFYEPGFHQLASATYGFIPGSTYYGLQLDSKVGQYSRCAEPDAIVDAWKKAKDKLRTIVTVRGRRAEEGGGSHIVTPCEGYRENLSQLAPLVHVIILGENAPIKLPIKTLMGAYKFANRIRAKRAGEEDLERLLKDWDRGKAGTGLTYQEFVARFLKRD